ncbi:MAG: TetR/AcrR family transcriptional regulator [Caulobacteraceae bacterium]|nr:TetR/AcrR family transcriptional regulator [Caulobacteraceae bacterium]
MENGEAETIAGRAPRQARGRERREAIIDAAAEIVAEQGIEALGIHSAARRAGASIGSMYHFFQNREELLEALMQRHRLALAAISEETGRIPEERWRAMTADEVIANLFGRPLGYFDRRRDALAMSSVQESAQAAEFQSLLQHVMIARLGSTAGRKAAVILFAVSAGTLYFLRDTHFGEGDGPINEIVKVLTAYLTTIEGTIAEAG